MREKAIERLEAKKPKALGSRITVQRLGDIAILNFYYNKILKARYCINSETGEYETLDYELTGSGAWRTTKLGAQFGMHPQDYGYYCYHRDWMSDDIVGSPTSDRLRNIIESVDIYYSSASNGKQQRR